MLPLADYEDLDLSWWGWFLSPEGKVYGVFGGRDRVSDETRISPAALAATLKRVLAHHYDPRRPAWDVDGPAPVREGDARSAKELPGFAAWSTHGNRESKAQTCIHCHQVAEILRQPAVDAGTFDKDRDLRHLAAAGERGADRRSRPWAEGEVGRAGRPRGQGGDQGRRRAGGRRTGGQGRPQAVQPGRLSRRPAPGPGGAGAVELWWLRDGKPMSGSLTLADGWKANPRELDWRASVSQGNIGIGPGFFPLGLSPQERKARGIADGTLAVKPFFPPKPASYAWEAGVRREHVITAVDGEHPDVAGRAFLVWFRLHHDAGGEATFTVMDEKGREQKVTCKLVGKEW